MGELRTTCPTCGAPTQPQTLGSRVKWQDEHGRGAGYGPAVVVPGRCRNPRCSVTIDLPESAWALAEDDIPIDGVPPLSPGLLATIAAEPLQASPVEMRSVPMSVTEVREFQDFFRTAASRHPESAAAMVCSEADSSISTRLRLAGH